MNSYPPETDDDEEALRPSLYDREAADEDPWFLRRPEEDEPDLLPPLPRAEEDERAQLAAWEAAQAGQAAALARAAARFGALDERLKRGPEGWRHRLALIEASELSWLAGDRVSIDRLGLWQAMRISAAGEDVAALTRASWAYRRLTGGPEPEADLAGFLGRHEVELAEGQGAPPRCIRLRGPASPSASGLWPGSAWRATFSKAQ